MTDSNEKDKIGDVDSPKDGPCQSCDAKPLTILVEVGIHPPKDDRHEDGEGDIKSFPRFSDWFEEDGILFHIELFFFHHIPSDR